MEIKTMVRKMVITTATKIQVVGMEILMGIKIMVKIMGITMGISTMVKIMVIKMEMVIEEAPMETITVIITEEIIMAMEMVTTMDHKKIADIE